MLQDDTGRSALQALGARSVPVVARGSDFVFAQVLSDVVEFLDLDDDTVPTLSPSELATRYMHVLDTAIRLVRQMPDHQLDNKLPDRPRSWRVLLHHVFQIPNAYLDTEETGVALTYESLVAPPPQHMRTSAAIAVFGQSVRARFRTWWARVADEDFAGGSKAYFGDTSRHELLERTVWHSTQHVRQVASLLERAGVLPDRPLTKHDTEGLPLTDKIWD